MSRREPVAVAGAVIAFVKILLTWLVVMGWIDLTQEQEQATVMISVAAVDLLTVLLATYWSRRQVTPLRAPRDNTGAPLVRPDGEDPVI